MRPEAFEVIHKFLEWNNLFRSPGDFVEIGTLFGDGARMFAEALKHHKAKKNLVVMDVFDMNFDDTATVDGRKMSEEYNKWIKKYGVDSQLLVYKSQTREYDNIFTVIGDSAAATIPSKELSFGFIDGNHSPEYVENDFYLVWDKLISRGGVCFHDYGGNLPQVTKKIDELVKRHKDEILGTYFPGVCTLFFVLKK